MLPSPPVWRGVVGLWTWRHVEGGSGIESNTKCHRVLVVTVTIFCSEEESLPSC